MKNLDKFYKDKVQIWNLICQNVQNLVAYFQNKKTWKAKNKQQFELLYLKELIQYLIKKLDRNGNLIHNYNFNFSESR